MHPGIETLRAIEELSSPSKAFKSIDKLSSPFLSLTHASQQYSFQYFFKYGLKGTRLEFVLEGEWKKRRIRMMVWTWIYNLMKEKMSLLKADVITAVEF